MKEYGSTWRASGAFGVSSALAVPHIQILTLVQSDVLMTVDPKVSCSSAMAVPIPFVTTASSGDPARVP